MNGPALLATRRWEHPGLERVGLFGSYGRGDARDRLLRECWAMAEQPRALDPNRIGEGPLTRLSAEGMAALEEALRVALGLAGG